ncbi:MAG: glutamate mutase L [Candidatus Limnocylindria bacterium]
MTPTPAIALAIDHGSTWTKASVIGRVAGRWHVAAHVSQPTAWGEDELLRALTARLAARADRRWTSAVPALVGRASRIECHTPGRPGRIGLAAVSRDISGQTARRAAESAGWVIAESATLDDGRSLAERLTALQAADVDAWLLAGGFEGADAEQALEVAGLVAAARATGTGPVIWAGAANLAGEVEELFEPGAVTVVENPKPSADVERPLQLRAGLEGLLRLIVEPEGSLHLAPTAFGRSVGTVGRISGLNVLGVDLGARYATWALCGERGVETRVHAEGGLGSPALAAPAIAGRLSRSLPRDVDETSVADTLQNMRTRPAAVPQTQDEIAVMHAAARHQLAALVGASAVQGVDLLVGSGRAIAAFPRPGQAAELLVEGIRPLGVTQLAVDAAGVLAPLGSLDDEDLGEGVGALLGDALAPLGTAVITRGGNPGDPALRLWLRPLPASGGRGVNGAVPGIGHGGDDDRVGAALEVRYGQLLILPLPYGRRAEVHLELEPGVSLGAARRSREVRTRVVGGAVGLIVDTRDMPIALPRRADDREAVLTSWHETFVREHATELPLR